jgi:hypothetical protein
MEIVVEIGFPNLFFVLVRIYAFLSTNENKPLGTKEIILPYPAWKT